MSKHYKYSEYTFRLAGYSIETIPMNRLADYISDLATALGEHEHVHIRQIESGSVLAIVAVDLEADETVRHRLRQACKDEGLPEVKRAIERINRRLADDSASATLIDKGKKNIIDFPGATHVPKIGPVKQRGTLDGIPIRVGGRGKDVPVHLSRFGHEVYICGARREIARQIAKYMFETPVRVEGTGTWYRWPDGTWERTSFLITDFTKLHETDLSETLARLRTIELPTSEQEDLLETMAEIRNGTKRGQ